MEPHTDRPDGPEEDGEEMRVKWEVVGGIGLLALFAAYLWVMWKAFETAIRMVEVMP